MASQGMKKGVSKDDLKRMMKKMKTEGTIKHPMAKYNSLGHLICTVCSCQIKSDRLWNPHLLSRSHKENLTRSQQPSQPQQLSGKRPAIAEEGRRSPSAKRHKTQIGLTTEPPMPKSILKNSTARLLSGYSSPEDEGEPDDAVDKVKVAAARRTLADQAALPADFFDAGQAPPGNDEMEAMEVKPTEGLPEGFFDDARDDAKARNIEYVDKDELEWERFQSAMKEEAVISEQIQAEDDFVNTEERHLEEIDEQLDQWTKVNNIIKRKTELMATKMDTVAENEESNSSSDEVDIDEYSDWRIKKVVK